MPSSKEEPEGEVRKTDGDELRPLTSPTLTQSLSHLPSFLAYVFGHFPLAYLTVFLALLLLTVEYALLSVMMPLSGVQTVSAHDWVSTVWRHIADRLSLPLTQATWLWFFLMLTTLSVALTYLHLILSSWLAKQVHRHLSSKIFHRVLIDEPMVDIYRRSIGYYVTLAGDDTFRAGTMINSASQALAGAVSALAGFLLLYLFSAKAFAVAMIFLAACASLIAFAFRIVLARNQHSVELSRALGTAFIEALNGLRSLRSMSSEEFVHRQYASDIRRYVRLLFQIDAAKHGMRIFPALLLLSTAAMFLRPGAAASLGVTISYFFALTTILMRLFLSLGIMTGSVSTLVLDLRSAKDISELIGQAPPPRRLGNPSGLDRISSVALTKLCFAYPGGKNVLNDFTFQFEAGRMYAITGRSGAGKSTLADILLGLVDPSRGEILINGNPASDSALRSRIILVEQQARIFSETVRENVLLGMAADDAEVWNVLEAVELDAFVRTLPKGLDSTFQYQGANLSGGQRQRLGIARALIRKPQVLILDEAVGALDMETRRLVVSNLRRRLKEATLIFITHEDSLAAEADVIVKL